MSTRMQTMSAVGRAERQGFRARAVGAAGARSPAAMVRRVIVVIGASSGDVIGMCLLE
jgi:hypothetical protein